LFAHAVSVTTENSIAQINLGVALEQQGRKEEALAHYTEALQINPNRLQAHNDLANLLADLGRRTEALEHYREALRLKPDAPLAHENLGTLLVEMGKFDAAQAQYSEAARLAPEDPRPLYLMGKASLRQGHGKDAVAYFHEALQKNPNDVQTLTYLARVLASDEDSAVRNGSEAFAFAEKADTLTGGEQPFVLDALAMACAESGRFSEAEQAIRKGVDIATRAGALDVVSGLQQRLKLYQSSQPFRESFTNAVLPPSK
jgi:tetratricopeptide (TPR) repeat protein